MSGNPITGKLPLSTKWLPVLLKNSFNTTTRDYYYYEHVYNSFVALTAGVVED